MAKVLLFSYWPVFTPEGLACSVGLRVWGLARALADRGHEVQIAEPASARPSPAPAPLDPRIRMLGWASPKATRPLIEAADVVIVQANPPMWPHFVRARPRCLVVDLYAPILLEGAVLGEQKELSPRTYAEMVACVLFFLRRGDAFLCAGERQRRYYLGALTAAGRLNALTEAETLLKKVPMGVDPTPPTAPSSPLLRGRWVAPDAELLLWPGGIYPWFDALTPIRALARLRRHHPRAALLFVGAENPMAGRLALTGAAEARDEAKRLGMGDEAVRFAPWLPHEERAAIYFEADLAVTAHKPLLEAEFSWRTRTLDCLWGGVPLLLTEGDELGERAAAAGAAVCVPPEDEVAMAAAMGALLADRERREKMRTAARELATGALSWERVTEPLAALCAAPAAAPDRCCRVLNRELARTIHPRYRPESAAQVLARKAAVSLQHRGLSGTIRRGCRALFSLSDLLSLTPSRRGA